MQILVDSLLLGGVYAIIGVGFSLIYGVMNIINLAHGSMIMLGAYTTFWLFKLYGIDPFLSLPVSMLLCFTLGFLMQKFVINQVMRSGVLMTMILTYGFELFFVNLALFLWGADIRSVTTAYSGEGFVIGSVVIPYIRLGVFAASMLLTLVLYWFIEKTKPGHAIQATALNRQAAELMGIDIANTYALTYGIASALAGAAGSLLGMLYAISPFMEGPLLGKAFVIAVLGGLGNMAGAAVGGLVLALAENVGATLVGPSYQVAIGFLIFLLVLIVRPHGLIGRRFYAEL